MQIGSRLFYDQNGEILFHLAPTESDQPRKVITKVETLDLDPGIDHTNLKMIGVNTVTREVNFEVVLPTKTDAERIIELENLLLENEGLI